MNLSSLFFAFKKLTGGKVFIYSSIQLGQEGFVV